MAVLRKVTQLMSLVRFSKTNSVFAKDRNKHAIFNQQLVAIFSWLLGRFMLIGFLFGSINGCVTAVTITITCLKTIDANHDLLVKSCAPIHIILNNSSFAGK